MDYSRYIVQVFVGALSPHYEALSIEVSKQTTAQEITICIVDRLGLPNPQQYELAEVIGNASGQECKERRLGSSENPVALQTLWPQSSSAEVADDNEQHEYRFCLREKISSDSIWAEPNNQLDSQLIRDYFYKFLYQPKDKEYPDLCQLPNLTEQTLLDNLRARFHRGYIYTYVGSILISVNPFKYYPIYNPKYVKLYQNHRLGELPPHIFAIADVAYSTMIKQRQNQCIVISGESGSGKTESTLFLLHHLTMLSQKGSHGSGVEQTILSSGPVLEAFGNAKTAHNNNSSRFGKFIQVSYKENGLVQGACVQKYLLEKSRICSQAYNERSYHVFYYLLAGASTQERQSLQLLKPADYRYLNQSKCYTIEGCDEQFEFVRLKQSMEMVGFTPDKQHRLFAILSAVLLLGNIEFQPKKSTYHHDESVLVRNPEQVNIISSLLGVSEDTLMNALTSKKARVSGETLVMHYRLSEALAARDALAKCLYGALFDWIVLQVNYSLISLKESAEYSGNSIGVLDIFGFEDFGHSNRFEQFCINFANEHLQHYFNLHVFQYEQEEYRREGITWKNIDFEDNIDCLALIEGKPNGLLCILDDQCSFPGANIDSFLQKVNNVHKDNKYYEFPQRRELAFIIKHYAGKVKYQISDFKEKNLDLMRPELICVLKNSRYSTVREVAGADPVAVFRWSILRAFFRAVSAFHGAAVKYNKRKGPDDQRKKQKIHIDNSRILAAIENTQNRLRKTRHSRSRSRSHGPRHQKNLKTVKALAQKTQSLALQGRLPGSRKPPHTVTGQFQLSLQNLMEALNTANPFFIRCIKSNANKEPNVFGDEMVMRQLRYTGMLETVRIRQAGFNVRLTYDEFIHHYRILLPTGLLSSQKDVRGFLQGMQLVESEYQMGYNKIFMRESQKQKLDAQLHQTILSRIIVIQRWYRTIHQRQHYLTFKVAVVRLQAYVRSWIAQQRLAKMRLRNHAATYIQKVWRGHKVRKWYQNFRRALINFQACVRGDMARQRFQGMLEEHRKQRISERKRLKEEEELSLTSVTTVASISSLPQDQAEPIPPLLPQQPPPRRRSASNLQNAPSNKLLRRQSENILGERRGSECPLPNLPEVGRRLSETVVPLRRSSHGNAIVQVHNRQSDETSGMYTPPSSPGTVETDKPVNKTKSFRHRGYSKVPLADQKATTPSASAECLSHNQLERKSSAGVLDDSHSMLKLSKHFRRPLQKIMGKREGSVSESEDAMSYESQPQTPTSPVDYHPGFPDGDENDADFSEVKGRCSSASSATDQGGWDVRGKEPRAKEPLKPSSSLPDVVQGYSSMEPSGAQVATSMSLGVGGGDAELKNILTNSPHTLKQSTLLKKEVCTACEKPFTSFFINTGYKCIGCKKVFHSRCINSALTIPCQDSAHVSKENASPAVKKSRRLDQEDSWSVTRTSEFIDKSDEIIKDAHELRRLESYITGKLYGLEEKESEKADSRTQSLDRSFSREAPPAKEVDASARLRNRKDSQVDQMFCESLREFKNNLISTYSVSTNLSLKYKDLIKNFEQVMNTVCKEKMGNDTFPVTMGVNAFRGFLDEFIREKKKSVDDKSSTKPRKRHRKRKKKVIEELVFHGHIFAPIMVNIPTQCEVCNSFLWLSMKALTCQRCKVTCHQKCYTKTDAKCQDGPKPIVVPDGSAPPNNRVFAVPLENLLREGEKIPAVVDRLLSTLELHGLYTEGLYRKSGASSKVRSVKAHIERDPDNIKFTETPVHVLATILKSFFRDLPEPLLTFECYDPLLNATQLKDPEDQLQTTYNIIKGLPKINFDLLERLIFHMVRVAQHEDYNRMSGNALAIVFAPCILRSQRSQTVQDSLNDIAKQTSVLEVIIARQLRQVRLTLQDIDNVDTEIVSAGARLDTLRSSKHLMYRNIGLAEGSGSSLPRSSVALRTSLAEPSELDLEEKLSTLQDTRHRLELQVPALVRGSESEDDLLSTDMSRAGSYEDIPGTPAMPSAPSSYSRASRDSGNGEDYDEYSLSGENTNRIRKKTSSKQDKSDEDRSVTSRLHHDYSDDAVMV